MRLDLLAALNVAQEQRREALVVTALPSGEQRMVLAEAVAGDPLTDILAERLRLGTSAAVTHGGESYFVEARVPAVRLVIVGAVHVAQALATMAALADLDVTIVDPRTAFATPERFPGVPLRIEWPDEALRAIGLDRFTAVAALTHDPKIDDPALVQALAADCFYIGALGSRRTHAARCQRLLATGCDEAALSRIRAPIGLDIGAVSPAEIATSILGEVILVRHRKPTRDAQAPA